MAIKNVGEIEVLFERNGAFAKVLWARIENDNYYGGTIASPVLPQLKQSLHGPQGRFPKSRSHTHVVGSRGKWTVPASVHDLATPLSQIREPKRMNLPGIPGLPFDQLDWVRGHPTMSERRTIVIDADAVGGYGVGAEAWVFSKSYATKNGLTLDSIRATLEMPYQRLMGAQLLDWTEPQLFVFVYASAEPTPSLPTDRIATLMKTAAGTPPPDYAWEIFHDQPPVKRPIPPTNDHKDVGRNDPCWCGSGKKFKRCHGA